MDPEINCVYHLAGDCFAYHLSINSLEPYTESIPSSDIQCSILSYFVGEERTLYFDEFSSLIPQAFDKEILAAKNPLVHDQVLHYRPLMGVSRSERLHPQLLGGASPRLAALYGKGLASIRARFSTCDQRCIPLGGRTSHTRPRTTTSHICTCQAHRV
jgi:hypothetical protein